jgi:hypothetical protein
MSVKSLAGKRKRAAMRQDQPNATRSSLKVAAGGRRRVKGALVIDVGGTSVKILASGQPQSRSFRSGPKLTPRRMVSEVKKLAADWTYDVVSIGYPGRTQGITTLASVNSRNRELRWTHPVFIRRRARPSGEPARGRPSGPLSWASATTLRTLLRVAMADPLVQRQIARGEPSAQERLPRSSKQPNDPAQSADGNQRHSRAHGAHRAPAEKPPADAMTCASTLARRLGDRQFLSVREKRSTTRSPHGRDRRPGCSRQDKRCAREDQHP